jgi:hypothetical protein
VKYLLIIYGNKELWESFSEDDWTTSIAAQEDFNARFTESGELLVTYGLSDETGAKAVRVREGVVAVTDGPYIDAKEYVGSVYLIDVDDESRALEIAAELPFAAMRAVEVWPVLYGSG